MSIINKTIVYLVLVTILISAKAVLADQELEKQIDARDQITKDSIKSLLSGLSSNIDGFSSTIDNFLPDFQLSSLLLDDENSKSPIVADFGYLLFRDNKDFENNAKLQLKINRGSEVSKDLAASFTPEEVVSFSQQIDDFDDLELTFSYNIVSQKFGRDFEPHRPFFTQLSKGIFGSKQVTEAKQIRNEAQVKLDGNEEIISLMAGSSLLPCKELTQKYKFDNEQQNSCMDFNSAQKIILSAEADYNSLNPQYIAVLVNNQPQLQFSGSYKKKDDLIGADELSLKVSYEFGSTNLNTLYRKMNANQKFIDVYRDLSESYVHSKNDGRFKLALEYSHLDDHKFSVNQTNFIKKGGEKLTATAAYGRSILFAKDNTPTMRLDVSLDIEEFLDDTEGNDRYVGTATLTRKISDNLSVPISIQYANKSEFLNKDSKEVFANIGFKYEFDYK